MNDNPFTSNFHFLQKEFPLLANLSQSAEYHLHTDPTVTLFKLRQWAEKLVDLLFNIHYLKAPYKDTLHNRLKILEEENILEERISRLLHTIKNNGNVAVHQNRASISKGTTILLAAFRVSKWFVESYGEEAYEIDELRFSKPPNLDSRHALHVLKQEYDELETAFEEVKKRQKQLSEAEEQALKLKAYKAAKRLKLTEAEIRAIIDDQLRKAGWEVDTDNLRYSKGTRPEKGRNLAIAEWKVNGKRADYALFIGLDLYGIVEAKKKDKDVISDVGQAKIYAKLIEEKPSFQFLGQWKEYKVPFLFATNSRPYHPQLETKSGTWFLDARKSTNHPKPLRGWFSPDDLKELFKQNIEVATKKLETESFDYLMDKDGLSLRYYQIDAIKAIENKIANSLPNDRRALVAMATGTGKTRTIIGLCYRLIKSERFKRILFLVDRNILGKQATDDFNDKPIDDFQTFGKIYDIKGMKEKIPEEDTKIHFATVQSLVKRILYAEEGQAIPAVGLYDCIIIDEAHRGYILDKEMDEEEIDFKNQKDYISKYKAVLDYFDAFRIGLTATPALHTTTIFGKPVYRYSYRKAVIDGFLIDHEPPYEIVTELSENGIVWAEGAKPKVYDRDNDEVVELDELEDEIKIDIEGFNRMVITENFNKAVVGYLIQHLDPTSEEKTLIFAVNNEHANLIVKLLKAEFKEAGLEVDDDAIVKITGSVYQPQQQVINYKNELYPNIVVTVDLLTTGVDVPEICNLVFMRRIKSRILYDQMLGRATRQCDRIGKEVFKVFDAVKIYDALSQVSEMRPVVVSQTITFEKLVNELEQMDLVDDAEKLPNYEKLIQKQIDQLTAKIQRKKKAIGDREDNLDNFKRLSSGQTPEEFIKAIRGMKPKSAAQTIRKNKALFEFLDDVKSTPKRQLISEHKDRIADVSRGYGKNRKPNDYLEDFKEFLENNRNRIAAIDIICSRPKELTRDSLKELQLELAQYGYTAANIKSAWKQAKNEDIAADIISYIRTLTMGMPLESPEKRIERAFKKLYAVKSWTKIQQNWLERIKSRLLDEVILDENFFQQEPFKSDGGYRRLNKIFQEDLPFVIDTINKNLYSESA